MDCSKRKETAPIMIYKLYCRCVVWNTDTCKPLLILYSTMTQMSVALPVQTVNSIWDDKKDGYEIAFVQVIPLFNV